MFQKMKKNKLLKLENKTRRRRALEAATAQDNANDKFLRKATIARNS